MQMRTREVLWAALLHGAGCSASPAPPCLHRAFWLWRKRRWLLQHLRGRDEARARLAEAVAQLEGRLPKIAALLEDAEDDMLAFYATPSEHWPNVRSTNPLKRFNHEIARRTDVGIFPDHPA
jgi:transposase-like protein